MKKWYLSKTIWISLAEIVVGAVFAAKDSLDDKTGVALIIVGAVQAVLRLITNTGVEKKVL